MFSYCDNLVLFNGRRIGRFRLVAFNDAFRLKDCPCLSAVDKTPDVRFGPIKGKIGTKMGQVWDFSNSDFCTFWLVDKKKY